MKKKKITLESLAELIEKKSEEGKQLTKDEVEKLAVLVVNRFDETDKRLDKVERGVDSLKGRMAAVEYGQYEIQKKLDIVPTNFEIGKLEVKFEKRFQKIEAKIGLKQKAK